jgi:alkaline phosphatase D
LIRTWGTVLGLLGLAALAAAQPADAPSPAVAVFPVSASEIVLWVGAEPGAKSPVTLELASGEKGGRSLSIPVPAEHGFTGSVRVAGLTPGTSYRAGPVRFQTFAAPQTPAPVRIAFTGDVGGMDVCRDATRGYPGYDAIRARKPDLFLGMGDMIYADHVCTATGRYGNAQIAGPAEPAIDLEGYRAHWRYQLADGPFRKLLAEVPYAPVWDDHEVLNNFGPHHDQRTVIQRHLLPMGRQAFLEWNPIASEADPAQLYRELRLGKHVALYLLDTRSFRDSAREADSPTKTMLGGAQREWLLARLAASDATWNVILSSVPLSVPSSRPHRRDAWASGDGEETGYEHELGEIIRRSHEAGLKRLIWLTADAHNAAITRYRPLGPDVDFTMLEVLVGPLSAHPDPTLLIDSSFAPERLWVRPGIANEPGLSFDEAQTYFNFGLLDVTADGALSFEVVDATGKTMVTERGRWLQKR